VERLAFTAAVLINFGLVAAYRSKAQRGERFSLKEEGPWIAIPLRFMGLAAFTYVVTYMVAPGVLEWSLIDIPTPLRWIGAIGALGFVPPLLTWAQRSLGRNVTTTVVTREHHELVTDGPYRFVRHPLYTVGVLLYVSLALIIGSWFIGAVLVVAVGVLMLRLPKEEAMLVERFGDAYREYMRTTPRFLPLLRKTLSTEY
jgi:protein-S-isoprenylcysteine O-methyltransferase Ste14